MKRERSERKSGKLQGRLSGGGGNDSEESDWEPEAEVMPPEREQTRSGRQRKRPSFFQVVLYCDKFLKRTRLVSAEEPEGKKKIFFFRSKSHPSSHSGQNSSKQGK